jgi:nicotinamide-nucleotide adenylyltransferase
MSEGGIHRAVVIGRFQPFHNGHLLLTKQILRECNEAIIVVGSAQRNYTIANPFTAGERILMIRKSLIEGGVDVSKTIIIPLIDIEDNAIWFPMLISMLPPFDIIYSGNQLVISLASSYLEVRSPKFVRKKHYNGSYIRHRILSGLKWSNLVSKSVFDTIGSIDGINRIRKIGKHENLEYHNLPYLQKGILSVNEGQNKAANIGYAGKPTKPGTSST